MEGQDVSGTTAGSAVAAPMMALASESEEIVDPNRPFTSRTPPNEVAPDQDGYYLQINCMVFGGIIVTLKFMLTYFVPMYMKARSRLNVVFALLACVLGVVYVVTNLVYLILGVPYRWDCLPRSWIVGILYMVINALLWIHVIIRSRRAYPKGIAAPHWVYALYVLAIIAFISKMLHNLSANLDALTNTIGMCNYHPGYDIVVLITQYICQVFTALVLAIPALRIRQSRRTRSEESQHLPTHTSASLEAPSLHSSFTELRHALRTTFKRPRRHYTPATVRSAALTLPFPGLVMFVCVQMVLVALEIGPPDAAFFMPVMELVVLARVLVQLEDDRHEVGPGATGSREGKLEDTASDVSGVLEESSRRS